MSPLSFTIQVLLVGITLLAAALLLLGWTGWRQRERLQRAEREAQQLRADLQLLQERHEAQQAPPPAAAPSSNAHDELFRSLMDTIPGASFRCTPDDQWSVVFISDAIETLSGWAPANYYTSITLLHDFVHVDDRPQVHQQIQAALAQDKPYIVEYRAVHRDGRIFWVWERGHCMRNARGEVVWLDGVIIDISERKALEIALRETQDRADVAAAAKATFLSNMGHEVRTPLNAIIGFSDIVLNTSLDATQREHVHKTQQAARTLLKLVNDVLDMARLERGTLSLTASDFSVRELVHEALQAHRVAADQKGLALTLDVDAAVGPRFNGDAPRLRQVLDTMLDNAIKFTEHGTVRLQLGMQDALVLMAVHDTGIGIAPSQQGQIFEPFMQVDPSMSRRYGGTGLGMAIAQQLITCMGGSLSVDSTPGAGTSFRALVPLRPATSGGASAPPV